MATAGSGNSKYGRNSKSCLTYKNNNTRLKNKVKKVKRHLKRIARKIDPPRKHVNNGKPRDHLKRDRQAENWVGANA